MGKEPKYLKRLRDTQHVILKILESLLNKPIHVQESIVAVGIAPGESKKPNPVRKKSLTFLPYEDYHYDEQAIRQCLRVQDDYARKHDLPIVRFGPQDCPIISVRRLFEWCVAIAKKDGFSEQQEKHYNWCLRILQRKSPQGVLSPTTINILKATSPIGLVIDYHDIHHVISTIKNDLYTQLQDAKRQHTQRTKVKRWFRTNWQWLIAAILVPIIVAIITVIMIKKLGD